MQADAATYYYAGGTRQSGQPSQTSATEWQAFLGQDHVPPAYTVQYPRDLAPLIGDKTLDDSVADGMTNALALIDEHDDGQGITLVGVSQGAVVMAETKQALIADGFDPAKITVLTFGDPTNPDGGFLAKLDRWNIDIPGYAPVTHIPGQGDMSTVAIEYDLIADSPDNLNPVSWANAAMGAVYDHPSYSKALLDQAGRRRPSREQQPRSGSRFPMTDRSPTQAEAYYQHNLIKQKNLPLTRRFANSARRSPTTRATWPSTSSWISSTTCCGRSWTPATTAVSPAGPATWARPRRTTRTTTEIRSPIRSGHAGRSPKTNRPARTSSKRSATPSRR